MPLSPRLYHLFVRPRWLTKKYIHNHITEHFHLGNKTVLDFGAGTGANCSIFDADQYIGVEPDADRVELAKRLYPNHRFTVFDGQKLPADSNSIDYVMIVAVLHHIPDGEIAQYLVEFERVLKPEGVIIVMEPCLSNRSKFKNRFMNWYDDGEYIRDETRYLNLFHGSRYEPRVLKRFAKCFVYNEILFCAIPEGKTLEAASTHETRSL